MKKYFLIITLILISSMVYAEPTKYEAFSITIHYKDGGLSKENIFLINSPEAIQPLKIGDYSLKIYSFNNELLYESKFSISLEKNLEPNPDWFDDEGNQIVIPNETSITSLEERYFS